MKWNTNRTYDRMFSLLHLNRVPLAMLNGFIHVGFILNLAAIECMYANRAR